MPAECIQLFTPSVSILFFQLALHKAQIMEYHPHLHHVHRQMQRRHGKTRAGTIAQFASHYGDRLVPEAAREHFMTISVHLNPRSSVGTRIAFNQKDASWYDELCDTLGVDDLEWRGQPIRNIQPVTRLATMQPIRPRPVYRPEEEEIANHKTIGQRQLLQQQADTHALPYRAPASCQPGTFRRRQERYRKLALGMGNHLTALLVADDEKHTEWQHVKSTLRNSTHMHELVRAVAETPSLHDHLTERTISACKRAIGKERGRIQRLLSLRQKARRLTDLQHVGARCSQSDRSDGTRSYQQANEDDDLSDTEEDTFSSSSSSSAYTMDESTRLELDSLPAQIERALADHMLYHEPELRQSYSFLPFAAETGRKRESQADIAHAMTMPQFAPTNLAATINISTSSGSTSSTKSSTNARSHSNIDGDDSSDDELPNLVFIESGYEDEQEPSEEDYEYEAAYDQEDEDEDEEDDVMPPVGALSTTYGTVTYGRPNRSFPGTVSIDELYNVAPMASSNGAPSVSSRAPVVPKPVTQSQPKKTAAVRASAVPKSMLDEREKAVKAPAVATKAVKAPAVATKAVKAPAVATKAVKAPAVATKAVKAPAVATKAVKAPAVVRFANDLTPIQVPVPVVSSAAPLLSAMKKERRSQKQQQKQKNQDTHGDASVFFEEHLYSKELFDYAREKHAENYRKILSAYNSEPVHVALEHHTKMTRRKKATLTRNASIDGGEELLAHVATMHVPAEHCHDVSTFTLPAYPGYFFHDTNEVSIAFNNLQ